MASIKAQGLHDVTDADFETDDGDQYDKQLFNEKQSLFDLFWLFPSKQTREENWPRSLKDTQEPSFPSFTITTLSPMLHNMML